MGGNGFYDREGMVRGVIVAESPRRGRIYTASPESIRDFLDKNQVQLIGDRPRPFTSETYGSEADYARRNLQVVKVACEVEDAF